MTLMKRNQSVRSRALSRVLSLSLSLSLVLSRGFRRHMGPALIASIVSQVSSCTICPYEYACVIQPLAEHRKQRKHGMYCLYTTYAYVRVPGTTYRVDYSSTAEDRASSRTSGVRLQSTTRLQNNKLARSKR